MCVLRSVGQKAGNSPVFCLKHSDHSMRREVWANPMSV